MPDAEFRQKFEQRVQSTIYLGWKRMLTGRRIDATTVTLAGAPVGKVWVRGSDESREQTAVWGSSSRINAGVVVGPGFDGADEIKSLDNEQAAASFGDAMRYALLPPGGDETVLRSIPGNGFVPGRVEASQRGGLFVHVRGFWHAEGYWDDSALYLDPPTANDFDLTGEGGSASGMSAWVVVYYDPADDALHALTGADVFGDPSVLSELDLTAIALPDGVIPLGAVGIENGQTEITGSSRFADRRIFLGTTGTTGTGSGVHAISPTITTPTFIAAVALVATFLNTGASGSGGGAFLNLYSDDGAAMASGDRLGGLGWGGAEDAAGTRAAAVAIAAFALEAWSASAHGSYVRAEYTPLGTTTRRAAWFAGLGKVLTDNTAIDLLSITRATNTSIGGVLRYSIMVFDGTDLQVETGEAFYSGYNKGGTRVGTITKVNAQQDLSAGTLTTTWAISNVAVPIISINANSSLTPSAGYPLIRFTLDSFSGQAVALA